MPPAVEAQSRNHRITREVPREPCEDVRSFKRRRLEKSVRKTEHLFSVKRISKQNKPNQTDQAPPLTPPSLAGFSR